LLRVFDFALELFGQIHAKRMPRAFVCKKFRFLAAPGKRSKKHSEQQHPRGAAPCSRLKKVSAHHAHIMSQARAADNAHLT
jgi:hypothetical protein